MPWVADGFHTEFRQSYALRINLACSRRRPERWGATTSAYLAMLLADFRAQFVDRALEHGILAFKLRNPSCKIARRWHRRCNRGRLGLRVEGHAHLVAGAPLRAAAMDDILVRHVELERFGNGDGFRELE